MAPYKPEATPRRIERAINRISGQDAIARRASKRFVSDEGD